MFEFFGRYSVFLKIMLWGALLAIPAASQNLKSNIRDAINQKKAEQKFHKKNIRLGKKLRNALGYQKRHGNKKFRSGKKNFGLKWKQEGSNELVHAIIKVKSGFSTGHSSFNRIRGLGGKVIHKSRTYIEVQIPFDAVEELSGLEGIDWIRTPERAIPKAVGYGSTVAQSLQLVGAEGYQNSGITGQGVKVAVLDGGFGSLSQSQSAGELPSNAFQINLAGGSMETSSEHGTNVAEHVMDMAPDATLYLIKVLFINHFETAVDYLKTQNIDIANLSMGWGLSSYGDDEGPFNDAVNDSHDNDGVLWVVSAGNDAEGTWKGTWSDADNDSTLDFSGSDEELNFSGTGHIFVKWDQYSAANTDLDLYILDKDDNLVGSSTDNQWGAPGQSYEEVTFNHNPSLEPYKAVVHRFSGSVSGLSVTVHAVDGNIDEYGSAASSLMYEPATSHGALTVGAVAYFDWNESPVPIETFSSQGPTHDGRIKPDVVGPDGTVNSLNSNNFGTSFSAPNVAGMAALMLDETPGYTGQTLKAAIISNAIDVGAAGTDNVFGAGKVILATGFAPVLAFIGNKSVDQGQNLNFTASATDPNSNPLSFSITGLPPGASFNDQGDGTAIFDWSPGFPTVLTYDVTITVSNGNQTDEELFTITLNTANAPPVITAQANALAVNEDNSLLIQVSDVTITDANDPGGPFTLVVGTGSFYTFVGNTITPDQDYYGTLTVPVIVSDGAAVSAPFNLSVTVNQVNDPPVIVSQNFPPIPEDSWFVMDLSAITWTDPDPHVLGDFSLTIYDGANYTRSVDTIWVDPQYSGDLLIPAQMYDGTDSSVVKILTVGITAENDVPYVSSQKYIKTLEETPLIITLDSITVVDADDPVDSLELIIENAAGFIVDSATNTVTPEPGWGLLYLPIHIFDGDTTGPTYFLEVNVIRINDPPVYTGQAALFMNEDDTLEIVLDSLGFSDDSIGASSHTLHIRDGVNYTHTGNFVAPGANLYGVMAVNAVIFDGQDSSTQFEIYVTVNEVNDAPFVTSQKTIETPEETPITITLDSITVYDADDPVDSLQLIIENGTGYTLDSASNTITPDPGWGLLSVPVHISDGDTTGPTSYLTLNVKRINDPPVYSGQVALSMNEDDSMEILIDSLVFTDDTVGTHTLHIRPGANYTHAGNVVAPGADLYGVMAVNAVLFDEYDSSAQFEIYVTVNPLNDAPFVVGQRTIETPEETPITLTLDSLQVVDIDNPIGDLQLVIEPSINFILDSATNTITPVPGWGTVSLPIHIADLDTAGPTAWILINVTRSNDPPAYVGQAAIGWDEDTSGEIFLENLLYSDDSIGASTHSLHIRPGTGYTHNLNVVTPAANLKGTLTVNAVLYDGQDSSVQFEIFVTVHSVNDVPVIDSLAPAGRFTITETDSLRFTALASDVDSTALAYSWSRNGVVVWAGPENYTMHTNYASAGTDTIEVTVSDGIDQVKSDWIVTIENKSSAPKIISGKGGDSMTVDSSLKWWGSLDERFRAAAPGEVIYKLEFYQPNNINTPVFVLDSIAKNDVAIRNFIPMVGLHSGSGLYWKVTAFKSDGLVSDPPDSLEYFILIHDDLTGVMDLPSSAYLKGSYPNPFRTHATIRYGVPPDAGSGSTPVLLEILDIKGQVLEVLFEGRVTPGHREVLWDASALTAGIYYYRITIGRVFIKSFRAVKLD